MPYHVRARCTCGPGLRFEAAMVERRDLGPKDVLIDIAYAGICHSDIMYARGGSPKTLFPLVPGHEIAGLVAAVGTEVTRFRPGDRVGVGVMVDSCRSCPNCRAGLEQYCSGKRVLTYNSTDRAGRTTYGGYSERIVVDEAFTLRVPDRMPLPNAAPLMCAGITMYSPLKRWGAGKGRRVGILGFGGLGHVGVQIARSLGAHVTALDRSLAKRDDSLRLGADDFADTTDPATFARLASSLDLIVSTVPGDLDCNAYLGLLTLDGVLVNTGVPEQLRLSPISLLNNRRSIAGTRSGSLAEMQEMLDFFAEHGIGAEVEIIGADAIDAAYDRVSAGDVRYRFVIDIATLATETSDRLLR